MNLRVRPQFFADLAREQLWLLEHAGTDVADRWHEAVFETIKFLEANPVIGRERKDLKHPGIRSWRVNHFRRWLIFYGLREDALILHRVVYGMRDLPRVIVT